MQPQITPEMMAEATGLGCIECGGVLFDQVFKMFAISALAISNKTRQDIPIHQLHFRCVECGHLLGEKK